MVASLIVLELDDIYLGISRYTLIYQIRDKNRRKENTFNRLCPSTRHLSQSLTYSLAMHSSLVSIFRGNFDLSPLFIPKVFLHLYEFSVFHDTEPE